MKLKKALQILKDGGYVRADYWTSDHYIWYDGYKEKFLFGSTKTDMETPFVFGMVSLEANWIEVEL